MHIVCVYIRIIIYVYAYIHNRKLQVPKARFDCIHEHRDSIFLAHTYMHTYIHTHIHSCKSQNPDLTASCTSWLPLSCSGIHTCIRAAANPRMLIWSLQLIWSTLSHIHTDTHTYIHTHEQLKSKNAQKTSSILSYTYIHTHIHTCIHGQLQLQECSDDVFNWFGRFTAGKFEVQCWSSLYWCRYYDRDRYKVCVHVCVCVYVFEFLVNLKFNAEAACTDVDIMMETAIRYAYMCVYFLCMCMSVHVRVCIYICVFGEFE